VEMKGSKDIIGKLADQITLERLKLSLKYDIPVIPYYKIEEALRECKSFEEARRLITLWLDLPRQLAREYKKPCLQCRLTYQEPQILPCYECERETEVTECVLREADYGATVYLCGECCAEYCLLKGGPGGKRRNREK